jgi:hypothetical protein
MAILSHAQGKHAVAASYTIDHVEAELHVSPFALRKRGLHEVLQRLPLRHPPAQLSPSLHPLA